MKLSRSADARMIFRNIYWFLIWFFLTDFLLWLISSRYSSSLRSFVSFIIILVICITSDYSKVVFFEKPYIYLKNVREKINPLNDLPIRLPDITGYSVDNPFPAFRLWCWSSQNLTLHLLNGKHETLFVKEQSMLIDWLKENNICYVSKKSTGIILEHIMYTVLNLFFIVFYKYQIKSAYTESGFTCLLMSIACFVYWIIYIVSGLYIRKRNSQLSS